MPESALLIQRRIILDFIRFTAGDDWKVVVLDENSKRLVDNVVREDDILKEHVTNIEQIEERRPANPEMDAIYILSPMPHIVDCLLADLDRRRYRKAHVAWLSGLPPTDQERLDQSGPARGIIASMRVLDIEYYPKESHLITFRDPWSFPILYHPACNHYVRKHLEELARKIVSVAVSLGEYPIIRFYNPRNATHDAAVLCSHLARFVQTELDEHAKYNHNFPPASTRPRAALIITDRSMDLFAPLVHEFTYQAMVHDLLPLVEGDKTYYKTRIEDGNPSSDPKEVEINESDNLWTTHRHLHMKDVLDKLAVAFQKFKEQNPQFAETENPSSLNNIKDMLAGLPQYQEGKEAFSLHLNMASDAMAVFQRRKLGEIASIEQSLATGLDEDYKKPKNVADQVVRLLDETDVSSLDRLRLIIQYLLYRDGLLPSDTHKLLAHSQLPAKDAEVIQNLELIGSHVTRALKDSRPLAQPLFSPKQAPSMGSEDDSGLSRFEPALKVLLEEQIRGSLDQNLFPFTKPHLDPQDGLAASETVSQASLRSAKPTWARTRPSNTESRQRIIVFVAGGATYSESRACYEISHQLNKEVFLVTTHLFTPSLFLRQVEDLSVDRRKLNLPSERPKPRIPTHLSERQLPPPPAPTQPSPARHEPPVTAMSRVNLNPTLSPGPNGTSKVPPPNSSPSTNRPDAKLRKARESEKEKKKKHHFFGSKK